ncbi:MAG: PIN domain-containing protein [Spirochaetales bacterium]|nr:PIN domain-containing protein [Spirochaetales bacterium]
MDLVIDTNVLFSALLKSKSNEFKIVKSGKHEIYACQYSVVELFKHKEKLVRLSGLQEEELIKIYYVLLQKIHPLEERGFSKKIRQKAFELCKQVDEYDMMFVATALFIDGFLWTGDKKLIKGLRKKGYNRTITTAELMKSL